MSWQTVESVLNAAKATDKGKQTTAVVNADNATRANVVTEKIKDYAITDIFEEQTEGETKYYAAKKATNAKIAEYASEDTTKGTIEERLTNLGFKEGNMTLTSDYEAVNVGGVAQNKWTREGNYVLMALSVRVKSSEYPRGSLKIFECFDSDNLNNIPLNEVEETIDGKIVKVNKFTINTFANVPYNRQDGNYVDLSLPVKFSVKHQRARYDSAGQTLKREALIGEVEYLENYEYFGLYTLDGFLVNPTNFRGIAEMEVVFGYEAVPITTKR